MSGFTAPGLVHADPRTPELAADRHGRSDGHRLPVRRALFGARRFAQFAIGGNGNIGHGAVAASSRGLVGRGLQRRRAPWCRVTQGCQPIAEREITEADGSLLLKLDGERRSTCCWTT
jgi:hypothetical protein